MGLFSYICPKCRKGIKFQQSCVLRHVRHGELLGEGRGTYDGYGRVSGTSYRNDDPDNPNSQKEIWKSEYCLTDSVFFEGKWYQGKPMDWSQYRRCKETEIGPIDFWSSDEEEKRKAALVDEEWKGLKKYRKHRILSGTSAYHEVCFDRLSDEEKQKLVISKMDPRQGR